MNGKERTFTNKIKSYTATLIIFILAIAVSFTSQGVVLCFEPDNVCKLELLITKCDLSENSSNKTKTPAFEKQKCFDKVLDLSVYGNGNAPSINHPCTKEKRVDNLLTKIISLTKKPIKKTDTFINPSVIHLSTTKLLI